MLPPIIFLAGGKGTRLSHLFPDCPKGLVQLDGHSVFSYYSKVFKKNPFQQIIFSLGYLSEKYIELIKSLDENLNVEFVIEEKPLGTGGAIKYASQKTHSDSFFVINFDTFIHCDFNRFYEFHKVHHANISILLAQACEDQELGMVEMENDLITSFKEKGNDSAAFVNAGAYIINKDIISSFSQDTFSIEEDLFPKINIDIHGYFDKKTKFWDIGTPERYTRAIKEIDEIMRA